jgi:hypothetical protein
MSVKFRKTYGLYEFHELQNAPCVLLQLPSATYMLLFYVSADMLGYIKGNMHTNSRLLIRKLVS